MVFLSTLSFFKAKNTHFGKFRTPGHPPYLGHSPKNTNLFTPSLKVNIDLFVVAMSPNI